MFSIILYFQNFILKIVLLSLFFPNLIGSYILSKDLLSYKVYSLLLDKANPIKYFEYQNYNYEKDSFYDIIFQLKTKTKILDKEVYLYIYGTNTYYSNIIDLIKINEETNEFIDFHLKFDLNSKNEYMDEYPLIHHDNIKNFAFQYYYLVFQFNPSHTENFNASFIIFNTFDIIEITPDDKNSQFYYKYENDYLITKYNFQINLQKNIYDFLNIQLISNDDNNKFNISIEKYSSEEIYSSNFFNKLDYNMKIEDIQLFTLNLLYNENSNNNDKSFAIFFDFSPQSFNFQQLNEDSVNVKLLSRREFYFSKDFTSDNSNYIRKIYYCLEFLSNKDIEIKKDYFSLKYSIIELNQDEKQNNLKIKNGLNLELIGNNGSNWIEMKSYLNVIYSRFNFKADVNIQEIMNKTMIIKIILNNSEKDKLIIKDINFRFLPLITLTEDIYNDKKSYIKFFNSSNLIDRIGFYYIPTSNIQTNKIVYCPCENGMFIIFGEFDLSEEILIPYIQNTSIYFIKPFNNSNIYNGITAFTYNSNSNYFFQFGDFEEKILNNLKINELKNFENINKEIKFNNNINELYFFNKIFLNEFFILQANIIYGDISVDYLCLDNLTDNEKNFNNIFPLNKQLLNNHIKVIKNPMLINCSRLEIIRIVNNKYINENQTINNSTKNLLYINRYRISSEIEQNQLSTLFISSDDIITKYKININSINELLKYKFIIFGYEPEYEFNIIININNKKINISSSDKIRIYTGEINISKYNNQIRIFNNGNQNLFIWSIIGNFEDSNIKIFNASNSFFSGIMSVGKTYLFVFDYFNIINKESLGLLPYKFIFSLEKANSLKSNGYYSQFLASINFSVENNIFNLFDINSIYFELKNSDEIISFNDGLNFENFDSYLNTYKKQNIYTFINSVSGYLIIKFYMIYKYDISNKKNKLLSFDFDRSIYAINYHIEKPKKNRHLFFQSLFCFPVKDYNITFFQENSNISYSLNNNNDKGVVQEINSGNIFGYIDLNQYNNIINENEYYIGITKPGKLFMRYSYAKDKIDFDIINSMKDNSKYNSNINIEKTRKIENKDIFSISFDCLLKNTLTNYYLLILEEKEKDMDNECKFLSYLYQYGNNDEKNLNNLINNLEYQKFISFKDEGTYDRITKEITFEDFGNYKIYILAEEIENYSFYKLLGGKEYSYVFDSNENNINKEKEKEGDEENGISSFLIALIIILSLLILLAILTIYRYFKKDNFNQIIAFMNLPRKNSSNKINMLLNESLNSEFSINNSQIINGRELAEEMKERKEENISEKKDLIKEDNQNDLPPPPLTAFPSSDDIIKELVNQMKSKKVERKLDDKDKIYSNDNSHTDFG